jgi:hypothetical protein
MNLSFVGAHREDLRRRTGGYKDPSARRWEELEILAPLPERGHATLIARENSKGHVVASVDTNELTFYPDRQFFSVRNASYPQQILFLKPRKIGKLGTGRHGIV